MAKQVIILTRPDPLNDGFAAKIRATYQGVDILQAPVTEIQPIVHAPMPEDMTAAIFTSRNGVRFGPKGNGLAYCVGAQTARDAAALGWDARVSSGGVEGIIALIVADLARDAAKHRLCHFSGTETTGDLAEHLRKAGLNTRRIAVYQQQACAWTPEMRGVIQSEKTPVFPIFSPNSTRRLVAQLDATTKADFVAISQAAADQIPSKLVNRLEIAKAPEADSMLVALGHLIHGEKRTD